MPDGKAQIKFDEAYLKRVQVAITNSHSIYNRIQDKLKRASDVNQLTDTLVKIYGYAWSNIKRVPTSDRDTFLKYDEKSTATVRKAAANLKRMFELLRADKKSEQKPGYQ